MNYAAMITFVAIIAVCVYLLVGTKLVRFIQFFLTKKHYRRLTIKVEAAAVSSAARDEEDAPQGGIPGATRTPTPTANAITVKMLEDPNTDAQRSGLIQNLSYHGRTLMQFYTPSFAMLQLATCSKRNALPGYVIAWQFLMRSVIYITLTVAACLIYMETSFLDDKTK